MISTTSVLILMALFFVIGMGLGVWLEEKLNG